MQSKKVFWHVINKKEIILPRDTKELLVQLLCKVLIKIESMWMRQIKEQTTQLTMLFRERTVRSNHWRCSLKKMFLKIPEYPQETLVLESLFKKVAGLKALQLC